MHFSVKLTTCIITDRCIYLIRNELMYWYNVNYQGNRGLLFTRHVTRQSNNRLSKRILVLVSPLSILEMSSV